MMNETSLRDRSLDLHSPWWVGLLSLPLFAVYFAGVVGGSILQATVLPAANAGWLQQVGGIVAVALSVLPFKQRLVLLALFPPARPWLLRSILTGLSITLFGQVAGALIGDKPTMHGVEYFAYQATLPGISEELGFRGLVLGLLTASFLHRSSSAARIAGVLTLAAIPFASLHILEHSGFALIVLFVFTACAGVVLGWLRLSTGSLLAAMLAHNIANVASGLIDNIRWLASGAT